MASHCTDSVDYNMFRPHGRVNISIVDNKIAVFHALGPFNAELLNALQEIEPEALKALEIGKKDWVEVIIFEYSCSASDDLFIEFSSHLKEMKESGLAPLASAYVFPEGCDGAQLMTNKYRRCFEDAGLIFEDFTHETDAMSWVRGFI